MNIINFDIDYSIKHRSKYLDCTLDALWQLTKVAVNQFRSFDGCESNKIIDSRNGEELELGAGLVAIISQKQNKIYLASNLLFHALSHLKVEVPEEIIFAIEEQIQIKESKYEELLEKEGFDLSSCYGSLYRKALRDRTDYFMLKRKARLAKRLGKRDIPPSKQ